MPSPNEKPGSEKQRTWMEQHGGVIYIGAAFVLIALLVVVRTACN